MKLKHQLFKHHGEKMEKFEKKKPLYKLHIKNNKLALFSPRSNNIRDKKHKNILFSVNDKQHAKKAEWVYLDSIPFWGKLSGKWEKYSGLREYWRKFTGDLPHDHYSISLEEENQEENDKNVSAE